MTRALLLEPRNNSQFNSSLTSGYKQRLVDLGHLSLFVDDITFASPLDFVRYCRDNSISSILIFAPPLYRLPSFLNLRFIRSNNLKLFLYLGDSTEYFLLHDYSLARHFHGVFVTSDTDQARLLDFGICAYVVLSSYDPSVYSLYPPNLDSDPNSYEYLLTFVGDHRKADRLSFLNYLDKHEITASVFHGITHKEMCYVFRNSFISLNFTKANSSGFGFPFPQYQLKGRPTEIILANGFCVSEYEPTNLNTGCAHIPHFKTHEQLYEIVKLYLTDPSKRLVDAQRAREYCISKLTTNIAADLIHSVISSSSSEPQGSIRTILDCAQNESSSRILILHNNKLFINILKNSKSLIKRFVKLIIQIFFRGCYIPSFGKPFRIIDLRGSQYKSCGVKSYVLDQVMRSHPQTSSCSVFLVHDDPDVLSLLHKFKNPVICVPRAFNRFSLNGLILECFLTILRPHSWLSLHSFVPIPVIVTQINYSFVLHDVFALTDNSWFGNGLFSGIKGFIYRFIASQSIIGASEIFVDNKGIIGSIPSHLIAHQKFTIHPHGLFKINTVQAPANRAKLYDFVFTGNTRKYKNVSLLMAVWPRVLESFPSSTLCIISNDDNMNVYANVPGVTVVIRPSDSIFWDIVDASSYCLSTSLSEGVGYFPIECFLRSMPVIIPNIPVFQERFRSSPQAIAFEPTNPYSLLQTLNSILSGNQPVASDPELQQAIKNSLVSASSVIDSFELAY
jgi:hypothetical protein